MTDDFCELPRSTPDFQTELARQLEELIPEVVADGKIDVTKLSELLGTDAADETERFGLVWPGKRRAQRAAQEPTSATLRPMKDQSRDWDTTRNVFIEGDNLEVLKILQRPYHGAVAMIYIDPPYNTGNDFVYRDNYSDGLRTYLEFSRQVDERGRLRATNSESDGRYHSNWLSMMYPRLKLARSLLAPDGLIFVSIDDNELDNLKKILDEVFGESNLVATLAVEMSKTQGMKVAAAQSGQIVKNHEYILIYARKVSAALAGRQPLYDVSELYDSHYDVIWDGARTTSTLADLLSADESSVQAFERYGLRLGKADVRKVLSLDAGYYEHFLTAIAPNLYRESPIALENIQQLDLPPGEIVQHDKYLLRRNSRGTVVQLQPFLDGVRTTDDYLSTRARATIRGALWKGFHSDMMNVGKEGGVAFKNGKKPVRLLKQLLKWANRKDGIVLDFFAGSGTTAEAVVAMNAADGGTREFILVQLPEPIQGSTTVADITRERLSNIGLGLQHQGIHQTDQGFRAFRLAETSFDKWSASSDTDVDELTQQLLKMRETTVDGADPDGMLTEVLLKAGYSLAEQISELDIAGLRLWSVRSGQVLAHLHQKAKPTLSQLRAVVAKMPAKFIIVEAAFHGDDELKLNLAQICRASNVDLWTV